MNTNHANDYEVNPEYLPPSELWEMVEQLLQPWLPRPKAGHPPIPDKTAFYAMYYVLRTGIQWKALPRSLGAASTVHRRFQKWVREGIFLDPWRWCLYNYNRMIGLDWERQALDGVMTKAPLGCENTGPHPTDRAKRGTKRHLLTEGHGIPLAVVVTGAHQNDFKETRAVLNWFVERTPSWMNRFRRILIRWEKKTMNYEAFLHLACAYITMNVAGVLG